MCCIMKDKKKFCMNAVVIAGILVFILVVMHQKQYFLLIKTALTEQCSVDNLVFHTPNLYVDSSQKHIITTHTFWEEKCLKKVQPYIPEDAVIIDVGANIGNHSLFWASHTKAQKIYAFEPIPDTFNTLIKNIKVNHLEDKIVALNIGLSNAKSKAEILFSVPDNPALTSIKQSDTGNLFVDKLDNIHIKENRVDLIKIDVEGHERFVIEGARETIKKYKPIIWIEFWERSFEEGNNLMEAIGYKLKERLDEDNFLYVHAAEE